MSEFAWSDRNGAEHLLQGPALIEAEREAVESEIDEAFENMETADVSKKARLRETIRALLARLEKLRDDIERWNAYAFEQSKIEAKKQAEEILSFISASADVIAVAALHEEIIERFDDENARTEALDGPATEVQEYAIARSGREPKPAPPVTRREAQEWLADDPVFSRPVTDEGGWFEWCDLEGVIHRLASSLQIELQIAKLIYDLEDLIPELKEPTSENALNRALEAANSNWNTISALQLELDRYEQEQVQRVDAGWQVCRQDWDRYRNRQK